ncbi:Signal recognition particle subunit SRP68 [Takifugu flavidus]|uniref:Signal recognition particle subunit SRP68 n=1 Tax=Takifugu flavidus TaxID=433684 RepID=A0A5C6MZH3_9TELE|nr:Signal recognition particle subunit SRP68 [Takifugu flavidus]
MGMINLKIGVYLSVSRGYCSRRLRRLRKTLGFKMGNRHKFIGKKITAEMLSDSRYLLMVLMEAERAWSYAMQLKQEANTEPRKRFHLLSRLRKAAKHSEKLEKLCESPRVDAKTKLEAQAYTAYLTGMVEFELQEWKRAMEAFNKCKTIYEKLASAFTEEVAVLYRQRVEEISPNIRYCAYNIGDQNAINDLMQMRLTGGGGGMMAEKLERPGKERVCWSHSAVRWTPGHVRQGLVALLLSEVRKRLNNPVREKKPEGELHLAWMGRLRPHTQRTYVSGLWDSFSHQALITQARTKQAATMSEVEWRGRTVPVKIDKARVFLLGLADNEAAVAQVRPTTVALTMGVRGF